jgi:hypothetical protein
MQQHAPYAAGILPFSRVGDKVLWLVAEDVRDGAFSDFGGKAERFDHDTLEGFEPTEMTAMREFLEESYGLVLTDHQITNVFRAKNYLLLGGTTRAGHPYFCYVVQVPFIPHLRDTVRKLLGFFRMRNVYRSFVEKNDLRWVTTEELFGALPKRIVFSSTISANRNAFEKIERERWSDLVAAAASRPEESPT